MIAKVPRQMVERLTWTTVSFGIIQIMRLVNNVVLARLLSPPLFGLMLIVNSIFPNKITFDFFGQAVPNIPVLIFTASESADASGFTRAWGAALVLLTMILLANIGARTLLARSRRKLTG